MPSNVPRYTCLAGIGKIAIQMAIVLPGCSQSQSVSGELRVRLLRSGHPVKKSTDIYRIRFHKLVDGAPEPFEAKAVFVDSDGLSKPVCIPVGEYRLVVEQWDPRSKVDRLAAIFSLEKSPFVRKVDAEQQTIELDLDRPN